MAVKLVKGDLMRASEHIIGHQVNCQAVMGSGVAVQIKKLFPKVYEEYLQYCRDHKEHLLGRCQIVGIINGADKYVANLFGQQYFGADGKKYTNDDALRNALVQLYEFAKTNQLTVALPYKIGCDRGGGDWEKVSKMIQDIFTDVEVSLYEFTP
ncbi:macro domain-containing protein [Paenibacillus sp. N3.4]|uniref:macro domain-containing protein n=1 Tax=Paenibacillus sp. N3.4 TaxID=2603222 RepID=UPI0011C71965|nr:macro domain-containing protein [Paenibacillus sp. N3.4]TXK72432.1 macro domain-containing protein [Paenibacillus sp. N3.4]